MTVPALYLVSLCNLEGQAAALLRFDPKRGLEAVDVGLPPDLPVIGFTGIIAFQDGYLACAQSSRCTLVELGADATFRRAYSIDEVHDPHGLVLFDGAIHVVSTGTNRIVRLSASLGFDRVVQGAHDARLDLDHINDICAVGDRLYASRFGPLDADGLRNGMVFDVMSGEPVAQRLNEPHSVLFANGRLHVLDSATGILLDITPGIGVSKKIAFAGYARGLLIDEERVVAGRSRHRFVSRSTSMQAVGRLYADEIEQEKAVRAGIYDLDPVSGRHVFWPLPSGSWEVYGICREHRAGGIS